MYKVFIDGILAHDLRLRLSLVEGAVTITENTSDSFVFRIPPGNPAYDKITLLAPNIIVTKERKEIFRGRAMSVEKDMNGVKEVVCEGELAYLHDSMQRPGEFHDMTPRAFFEHLISVHNEQMEEYKRFKVGNVTVTDPNDSIYRYTNYGETTGDDIREKLIKRLGGYIQLRYQDGKKYIDYLNGYTKTCSQAIEYGENLLDYQSGDDCYELATVLIPIGARQDTQDGDPQALERYLTIESVNGGKDYIENEQAIKKLGRIVKIIKFDDVTQPENLLKKGLENLEAMSKRSDAYLTIKAADLHMTDLDIQEFRTGDLVRVRSKPHQIDKVLPIISRSYNLTDPSQDTFSLGEKVQKDIVRAMIETERATDAEFKSVAQFSRNYTDKTKLFAALASSSVGTYETERTDGTGAKIHYWHDQPRLEDSMYIRKSNAEGFFFTTKGFNSDDWKGVDKSANALLESLTAKTISADTIKAGMLKAIDPNSNAYFDLNNGELSATSMVAPYDIEFPGLSGKHNVKMTVEQVELVDGEYACGLIFRVDGNVRCALKVPFADGTLGGITVIDSKGNSAGIDIGSKRVIVNGDFNVLNGSKNRVVETSDGMVCIAAYETAEPMFGDIGEATTGKDGMVQVDIDPLFKETVNTTDCPYQVFLQPYADGNFWVSKRAADYFVVNGPANSAFAWEVKAHQNGYEKSRLVKYDTN